jgi:hypothetical protein
MQIKYNPGGAQIATDVQSQLLHDYILYHKLCKKQKLQPFTT